MFFQEPRTEFPEGFGGWGSRSEGWDASTVCNRPEASPPPCHSGAAQWAIVLRQPTPVAAG